MPHGKRGEEQKGGVPVGNETQSRREAVVVGENERMRGSVGLGQRRGGGGRLGREDGKRRQKGRHARLDPRRRRARTREVGVVPSFG